MMILPGIILYVMLEVYHQVCFRLYRIPRVSRKDHFVIDRHLLSYLNWIEKLNCLYCSFFNGLMSYGHEISGRTERYWCPIKHAKRLKHAHPEYGSFVDYLDAESFRTKRKQLRNFLAKDDTKKTPQKNDSTYMNNNAA